MVKRQCPKCDAIFNQKCHFESHMNKKFDCSSKKSNNNKDTILCQIVPNHIEMMPKYAEYSTIKNLQTVNNVPDIQNNNQNNTDLNCHYCQKKFSSKSTLTRHLKINCSVKKEDDKEKENIFKLLLEKEKQHIEEIKLHKEEVNELKKQNKLLLDKIDKLIKSTSNQCKTTTNNNISNSNNVTNSINTQNNIVMVNFGNEDLSIIDNKIFMDRIVKKPMLSGVKIPDEVLKIIHFNPQYPQLSNIYISDINRDKCMVWEDGEWKLSNVDNIPQIIDKVCLFSTEQINDLKDKYPNNKLLQERLNTIEKYNNMIDNDYLEDLKDNQDDFNNNKPLIKRCEDFQKHTYNTIKKTLYNEGKKIKKTKIKN